MLHSKIRDVVFMEVTLDGVRALLKIELYDQAIKAVSGSVKTRHDGLIWLRVPKLAITPSSGVSKLYFPLCGSFLCSLDRRTCCSTLPPATTWLS
jgi:hypothetical protein